ncbi:MAG: T9SS type A sorting domain-containing protein, partial [Bacteroidia bacterium]
MKAKVLPRLTFFICFWILIVPVAKSEKCNSPLSVTHYYTRSNGVYETNIWSNVSHASATCNCNPGCSIPANSVIHVAHSITSNCANVDMGSNVTLIIENGGSLTVSGNGSITGGGNLQVDVGGLLSISGSLDLGGTGSATINGTLNVFGSITASGGAASGGLCGSGNVNVAGSAQSGVICNSIVLPVELSDFYAVPQADKVLLNWQTTSESNNSGFNVERSTDGIGFEKINWVPSGTSNGNSTSLLNYTMADNKPLSGLSYYRLKQVDHNGSSKYSQIISVDFQRSRHIIFAVYPNPNQGQFTVDFTGVENNHTIDILMFDQQGKQVYANTISSESLATNTFNVIPEESIAHGVYTVNFVVEGVK